MRKVLKWKEVKRRNKTVKVYFGQKLSELTSCAKVLLKNSKNNDLWKSQFQVLEKFDILIRFPFRSFDFCFQFFSVYFFYRILADSVDASINRSNSNKNLLIAQISNLSDPDKARYVKHLSLKPSPSDQAKDYNTLDLLPTAAESFFPWRRDKSYQSLGFGIWLDNISNWYYYFWLFNSYLVDCTDFKGFSSRFFV